MMRKVNWNDVTAIVEGEFKKLAPGPYVARITDAKDNEDREYVEIVYDIAEGPDAGFYSDEWGKSHGYAHHFFMSYKQTALGMLKGRLEAITSSNPGFDAKSAWDAGRLDMFVGRIVGINLQEEEYEKNDGTIGTRLNVCEVRDAQKVRNGEVRPREKKAMSPSKPSSTAAPRTADVYAGEIPFN